MQALLAGLGHSLGKEKMSRCAKRAKGEMGRVRGERSACTESPPPTSIYTYLSKWDQDITLMSHCKSKDQNKNKCGATFFLSNAFTATSLGKDYWQGIC